MGVPDYETQILLDLDGEVFPMSLDGRFTAKFRARRVSPNENVPHGIRYAVNMHGPYRPDLEDSRYVGFDNAHGIAGSGPARIVAWDHRHRMTNDPVPYDFTTVSQLLADFYAMCHRLLDEMGVAR